LEGGLCPACLVALALEEEDEAEGPAAPRPSPGHSYQALSVLSREAGRTRFLARRQDFHAFVSLEIVSQPVIAGVAAEAIDARLAQIRSLRHPGLVRVMDAWIEAAGDCCIVSEYVAGRAIAHCRQLAGADALQVFDLICEAMAAAHGQGAPHGRLGPESVVLATLAGSDRVVPRIAGFTICQSPPRLADDLAGLAAVLEAVGAGQPFAARAEAIARRARQADGARPIESIQALRLAAAGLIAG
jgi:hypothetical protein